MTDRTIARPDLSTATDSLADTGLLAAITADPLTPVRLALPAPGGYGKSTVLAALAEVYTAAGIEVVDQRTASACGGDGALLVDDAHLLTEQALRELRDLTERDWRCVAIAYRPWPRPAGLADLVEPLTRVVLAPFDLATTAARVGGPRPRATALAEFVQAQTGGVPRLVAALTGALGPGAAPEVPETVLATIRHELDDLDADVLRFLIAVEAGAGAHRDLVAALLGHDPADSAVDDTIAAAGASGLLAADGTLPPLVRTAIDTGTATERRLAVHQRLAELQLARGGSVLPFVRSLVDSGVAGAGIAAAFEHAADEALPTEPVLSARLYRAAVTAGRPATEVAARWAQAAALAGDLDSALRLTDTVIGGADRAEAAKGAEIAATALVHRGQLSRGAELYRWSGTGSSVAFGSIALYGVGALADAGDLLATRVGDAPPTLLSGAASLMAQGVRESVVGSSTAALSALVRASTMLEPAGESVLLPDSPAALAGLVALHCGELNLAESVLGRAIAARLGGMLMSVRHVLLLAWIRMVRGQLAAAAAQLAEARTLLGSGAVLEPRDWLFAVGLEAGLARRTSDLAALRRTWEHACEAVLRHSVDLFTLLPLGEFAIAAARLRDEDRLAPHLAQGWALLDRLDNPPLWTTSLHWSCLHAAIIAEQPSVAAEHVAALARDGEHSRHGAALSVAAGCWLDVMAGKVDPRAVEQAALGLDGVGLWWDGARLAGQAAIRTTDRKAMVALLECARTLQGRSTNTPDPSTVDGAIPHQGGGNADRLGSTKLSERERQVAGLVLDGLTYREVGDRLFISAKTVEHHMARMRQRLGANSRSELLAQLRHLTEHQH